MSGIKLDGVALVTGAASGIGQEVAYAFAEAGVAAVIFADINFDKVKTVIEESNKFASNPSYSSLAISVDVESLHSVQSMVNIAMSKYGRIDYLVNSAGIDAARYADIANTSIEDYDHVMNVNSRSLFYVIREVAEVMKKQQSKIITGRNGDRDVGKGSIVNVSSALAYGAVPGKISYIASKHAALGITKSAALENAGSGIRVNMLSPTWTRTAMYTEEVARAPLTEHFIKAAVPCGRPALPEEVAEAALFLCSPSASYITGVGLIIDAGLTLTVHLG